LQCDGKRRGSRDSRTYRKGGREEGREGGKVSSRGSSEIGTMRRASDKMASLLSACEAVEEE